jgi:hypothetical protein
MNKLSLGADISETPTTMGSTHSTRKLDYLVPKQTRNRQLLINEALARNQSSATIPADGVNFLSTGKVVGHLRGELLWQVILAEPPATRINRVLSEMPCFADVITVVFTDWSATETEVDCCLPVSEAFLNRVTSTTVANWAYLVEHACDMNKQTAIQALLCHVCERIK